MVKRLLALVSLACFVIASAGAQAPEITVRVDRESVRLDESFQFVIETQGEVNGEPDFSPLTADFEIRNRRESQNIQIVHGQFSRLHQWSLTLIPRRAGALTIPPVTIGSAQSPSLRVQVAERASTAGGDPGPLFLEAEVTPDVAYVQSQLIYRSRLYRSVETRIGRVEEPVLLEGEALIERLGEDRGYETRRHGRRYTVVERRYLVSPQRSGPLVFAPLTAEAIVVDSFSAGGRYLRVRAAEVRVDVRPVPEAWGTGPWLPARNVKLAETWSEDPGVITAGESVSHEIVLEAEGMAAELLPELAREVPSGMKIYPGRTQTENRDAGDAVSGRRISPAVLIPATAGAFNLPPVRLEWWNTIEHRKEVAELPSRAIEVRDAPAQAQPVAAAAEHREIVDAGWWPALSAFLGIGWLLTWIRGRGKRARTAADAIGEPATRSQALGALKSACESADEVAAVGALLAWGRERWPDRPPYSAGAFGERCGGRLAEAVRELDRHCYGRETGRWDGVALLAALDELPDRQRDATAPPPALVPLNPTASNLR